MFRTYCKILHTASAHFHKVNTRSHNQLQLFDAIRELSRHLINRVDLDADSKVLRCHLPNGLNDVQDDLDSGSRRTPIVICPFVAVRRHELCKQIAVRSMDLDSRKPSIRCQPCRCCELMNHFFDFLDAHCFGRAEQESRQSLSHESSTKTGHNGTRSHILLEEAPGSISNGALPAWVVDLHDCRHLCAI